MDSYDSAFRPGLFAGRTVLITGGGTGIGRCTAHELANLGATVVLAGRRLDVLEATAAEIHEDGGLCEYEALDLRDTESIERAIAAVIQRVGRIDGLFNNAGGQFAAPAENVSVSAWQKVVDLNLNGTFRVTKAVFEASMREHGGAVVSMLADIQAGFVGMAHSSAARAGIENLTRTLALEWSRYDIRLNAVAPGTILSSGMASYPEPVQQLAADGARTVPAARLGTESEVSAAVVFLLSPAAAFITGQTLAIDGGSAFEKGRLFPVTNHAPMTAWNGFHRTRDWSHTPFETPERD